MSWLLPDSLWRYKLRVILILIASFIGASLQGLALGQAIFYARLLEKGKTFRQFGYSFEPRESIALLIIFAVGILVSLSISGLIIYYARSRSIRQSMDYESLCSLRACRLLGSNLRISDHGPYVVEAQMAASFAAVSDSRYCARTLRIILWAITPMIQFFIFLGLLLFLDPVATLIVCLFKFMSPFFLLGINRFGAR